MRGTWHARAIGLRTSPTPSGGVAIADVIRAGTLEWIMEILDLDNNRLGCIMVTDGMDHPVVGRRRPDERFGDDVTGGMGAFVGIRGQMTNSSERSRSNSPTRASDLP